MPRSDSQSKYTIAQVEDALRKSAGICAHAAELLSREGGKRISRQSIWTRVQKHERLQRAMVEIRERTLDLAESQLLAAIGRSHMTAIIFYLKTQGKNRGYVERFESTGPAGGPIQYLEAQRQADQELQVFEQKQDVDTDKAADANL